MSIRVEYAGVNYADVMQREGRYPHPLPLPYVPGHEVAGVVEAVGSAVVERRVGDRVAAILPQGAYAEYAVADAVRTFPVPDALGSAEATALLIQGSTALLLVEQLVRQGDDVLITAAGGGVGALTIQLARLQGARSVVGAVGSREKAQVVERLGARAVTYEQPDWEVDARAGTQAGGFRVVIDAVGGRVRDAGYRALAPFGRMGIYGNSSQEQESWDAERFHALLMANQAIHGYAVTAWMVAHPSFAPNAFRTLAEHVIGGRLAVPVHSAYSLADAQRAHRDLEMRRTLGKVVLRA